eukprot:TRINITY_DN17042_c0_g1_i1.p1 TRINITY_DN17042_c0_g1~~TRINITY_DN17042_c0_g1_i1.p1  ORF type:complete len:435 (+),score=52.77 TRINITY_DN17042_c0_g1_i1:70-1374(+)
MSINFALAATLLMGFVTVIEGRKETGNMFNCDKATGEIDLSECDEDLYVVQPETMVLLIMVAVGLCFCLTFPCGRCIGMCGGVVPTEKANIASCGDFELQPLEPDDEDDAAMETSCQQANFTRSKFSIFHPRWAKRLLPVCVVIFTILGLVLSVVGLTKVNDDVVYLLLTADEAAANSFDPIIMQNQLTQMRYPSANSIDAAQQMIAAKESSLREIDETRDDIQRSKVPRNIAVYVSSFAVLPLTILLFILIYKKCGRNYDDRATRIHFTLLITANILLMYVLLMAAVFTYVDLLIDDTCYEIRNLANVSTKRGYVRARFETMVCPDDIISSTLSTLEQEQEQALSSGLPATRQVELIASITPLKGCNVVIQALSQATSGICSDLHQGVRISIAGTLFQSFALVFLISTLVLGYKRWIPEEFPVESDTQMDSVF